MKFSASDASRVPWVDFLRSVSIFLVIVIHTSGPLLYQWENISRTDWMMGNIYDSFARAAVPLLFMVSGYLLLGKQESISTFYRKRFKKVLIPFLIWSVLYLVWEKGYRDYTFLNAVKAIVYEIFTTPASIHMWFLYELMAIYLFVPLMRIFLVSAQKIHLWYFAGIWLLFGPVLEMIERILGLEFAIHLGFLTSYIGYFVIGYLLGKTEFSTKMVVIAGVLYAAVGAYTIYATYSLSAEAGDYVQYYYWYLRLNVVLMSVAAFMLLMKLGTIITNERLRVWYKRFAEASFGVYLIHVFILINLKRAGISAFTGSAAFAVPLVSGLVLLISWGIVAVFQRIPILRITVPK